MSAAAATDLKRLLEAVGTDEEVAREVKKLRDLMERKEAVMQVEKTVAVVRGTVEGYMGALAAKPLEQQKECVSTLAVGLRRLAEDVEKVTMHAKKEKEEEEEDQDETDDDSAELNARERYNTLRGDANNMHILTVEKDATVGVFHLAGDRKSKFGTLLVDAFGAKHHIAWLKCVAHAFPEAATLIKRCPITTTRIPVTHVFGTEACRGGRDPTCVFCLNPVRPQAGSTARKHAVGVGSSAVESACKKGFRVSHQLHYTCAAFLEHLKVEECFCSVFEGAISPKCFRL